MDAVGTLLALVMIAIAAVALVVSRRTQPVRVRANTAYRRRPMRHDDPGARRDAVGRRCF